MSGRSAKQNRRLLHKAQVAAEAASHRTKVRLWLGAVMAVVLLGLVGVVLLFVDRFPGPVALSP